MESVVILRTCIHNINPAMWLIVIEAEESGFRSYVADTEWQHKSSFAQARLRPGLYGLNVPGIELTVASFAWNLSRFLIRREMQFKHIPVTGGRNGFAVYCSVMKFNIDRLYSFGLSHHMI
jgi:hypothetical protein